MKNKTAFFFWMAGLNILGVLGYKIFTGIGASKAYDYMTDELDSGETCMMDKGDKVIFVRKVSSVNSDGEKEE